MKTPDYLIHYNGKGRFLNLNTGETTSAQFGKIQRAFAKEAGAKGDDRPFADMVRLWPDCVANGLFYHWELSGANGASYNLVIPPCATKEQVRGAKEYLRKRFDVVCLYETRIKKII